MLWAIFSHFRAILLCTQLQVLLSQHAILDSIDGDPCTLKKYEKIKTSNFLGWSQPVSKHDCTCYGLFLAISEQFYCSPNFRYWSPNMPYWTVLMGTLVLWKNLKKLKEIFRNKGNTSVKYSIVWRTFGQKPLYRSKCPSCSDVCLYR